LVVEVLDTNRGTAKILHAHAVHAEALNGLEGRLAVRLQIPPGGAEEDFHG